MAKRAAMASRGRGVKMLLMPWGHVPPSGGPYRDQYLDLNGREALRVADEEYAAALAILGDHVAQMPVLHTSLVERDGGKRLDVQAGKAEEWRAFVATLDVETVRALAPHLRLSESAAVAALNFLEDHQLVDTAHAAVHRAAFVRGGILGCPVTMHDDEVWTDCSMQIHQLRVGASVGMVSDFACSICGEPVEDCEHLADRKYPKVASKSADGRCTICDAEACDHAVGESYLARAHGIALNIKSGEVSIVDRPRYPMARITDHEMDFGDLATRPGVLKAIQDGDLHCQECLGPCEGFIEFGGWDPKRSEISVTVDDNGDFLMQVS